MIHSFINTLNDSPTIIWLIILVIQASIVTYKLYISQSKDIAPKVSKQYIQTINQPEAHFDFDVMQIFNQLSINTSKSIICRGLGFTAIANDNGKCKVRFVIRGSQECQWYPIELVTRWTHCKFMSGDNQILLLEQDERGDQDLDQWCKSFEMIVGQPYTEWRKDLKNICDDEYYWIIERDMYRVSCNAGEQFLVLHRIIK